jgi:arabinogalactan oligomer/maltooligosaccharide transport system substrate-binding protein
VLVCGALPARAQVTVVLWHPWHGQAAALLESWIAAYAASNDGRIVVRAEYVPFFSLPGAFANPPGGERPDMVIGPSDWAGNLIRERLVAQLDGRLSADFRARIPDLAWEAATFDARIIGIPLLLEGTTLYYRRGPGMPATLPMTWDALLAVGETAGLVMPVDFYPTAGLFFALGGTLIDASGSSLLRQGEAFSQYLSLLRDVWARAQQSGSALALDASIETFRAGRAAFFLGGSWDLFDLRRALDDDLGVAPLPMVGRQTWAPLVRTQQIYVALDGLRIDAVMDFARFVTGEAAQILAAREAALVPANSAAWSADPHIERIADSLAAGVPVSNRAEMALYWPPLRTAIRTVTARSQPVETAAAEAQDAIDAAIARFRNP